MLVVNDKEGGYQAIEMCETFYDTVLDDPDDGGGYDNIDDSSNVNDIDSGNYKRDEDRIISDVGGDTDDVDTADTNDVAIDNSAYTPDPDNSDVGYNTNNHVKNDADNYNADDDTKHGNNFVMGEVPILLMMLTLIRMMLSLKPNMV